MQRKVDLEALVFEPALGDLFAQRFALRHEPGHGAGSAQLAQLLRLMRAVADVIRRRREVSGWSDRQTRKTRPSPTSGSASKLLAHAGGEGLGIVEGEGGANELGLLFRRQRELAMMSSRAKRVLARGGVYTLRTCAEDWDGRGPRQRTIPARPYVCLRCGPLATGSEATPLACL